MSAEVEPGASSESVLIANDEENMFENFEQNMSSSLKEINSCNFQSITTQSKIDDNLDDVEPSWEVNKNDDEDADYNEWVIKDKHIFVLSQAGKPIYSRYGNEDKLAWLYGVMQTLVSFVQSNDDRIRSIHAGDTTFVFLVKKTIILVAVSRTQDSVSQLILQLNYVFNQIASVLTLTRLNAIYDQRQNYDLRRLLSGVERLIDHLLDFSEKEPAFTLGSIQCLSLSQSVRDSISSTIVNACSKIKKLVFAILLANNKLITLVRMKKYCLHPADLHLIFNLIQASESFKTVESWTPLCLPRFDASGFLYGHVSYLSDDCQACLLLLTVEKEMFFALSEAKQKIAEKLRRNNALEAINESLGTPNAICADFGFPEIRHFLYKCKSTAQFYQPGLSPPYNIFSNVLMVLYKRAHQTIHCGNKPLKLLFATSASEAVLGWDTRGFELYVVFEPLIDTNMAINSVTRLLNWIKKREDRLFHLSAPTF